MTPLWPPLALSPGGNTFTCEPRAGDMRFRLRRRPARVELYLQEAAQRFDCTRGDILAGRQLRRISQARQQVALRLVRDGASFPEIGRLLGIHHTTVVCYAQKAGMPPRSPRGRAHEVDRAARGLIPIPAPVVPDLSGEWAI